LHGQGLDPSLNEAQIFYEVTKHALGHYGILFIGLTVFLACLSTMIALASVVAEYLRNDIFQGKINYTILLVLVLATSVCMAQLELGPLMNYAVPIIKIIYPVLIVLTLCNLAYKLFNFTPIKVPVLITLLVSSYLYLPTFIEKFQPKLKEQAAAEIPNQNAADTPFPGNEQPEALVPN
jgi:branched-chain amino acid:cation transporter, LIVCS family